MAGRMNWHGGDFRARLEAEMGKRLDACAVATQNHAKKLISAVGTTKDRPGRNAAGKFTKGKLRYNTKPSAPGEPPHVQTGRLRASVANQREALVARVGTNLEYGRFLELGTGKMAARPWLRRALNETTPFIRAVLSRPIK